MESRYSLVSMILVMRLPSISTDETSKFVSGANGGNFQVYRDGSVVDYPEISVTGSYVGTIYEINSLYSAYTNGDNLIQIREN